MLRIGIFGGTFNPVHIGHLIAAQEVLNVLSLDRVLFIPTGNPPHKDTNFIAPANQRLEMVKLAVEDNTRFYVSEIEIERKGMTYTYDTLKELHNIFYGDKLYFILGYDAFRNSDTWKNAEVVLKMVSYIVVNRGNISMEMEKEIEYKKAKYNVDVKVIEIPDIEISSTEIRKRISRGQSVRYMVPDKVYEYIISNGLYRGEEFENL